MSGRSLTIVILVTKVVQLWCAEITCDSGCLQNGQPHNITCKSLIPESCLWYKDSSKILTCPSAGDCIPEATGYDGERISDTHYVLHIEAVTASTYECRFGTEQAERCPISVVTAEPAGTLIATCSSDVITCSGINDHGTPAVTLELKHGSTILTSTTTGGSVSITQSGSAGKIYTCAVTGTGSGCLSTNSLNVTCSDDIPVTSTTSPSPPFPTVVSPTTPSPYPKKEPCIIILAVALAGLVVCVVVVIGVRFGKEKKFPTTCVVCGSILACVGVGCTIAVFIVCTRDVPIGKAATAFSIIDIIIGIGIIVIRFLPNST